MPVYQRAGNQTVSITGQPITVSTSGDYSNKLVSGTITAQGDTVTLALGSHKSCAATVSGTWTGTLVIESSTDNGNNWVRSWVQSISALSIYDVVIPVNSFTVNGAYSVYLVAGITHYRVRSTNDTAWTGTAGISMAATEVAGAFFGTNSVIQNVLADAKNSSTSNLEAANSYSFTGAAQSSLGIAGIQVSLFTNKNCIVKVQQSPDGTNWDLSDQFFYTANANFGVTVQAVASYLRVIVTTMNETTTTFRLQTALCPIVEALPRTLDPMGNLQIANPKDAEGNKIRNTPNEEMLVATKVRLVGAQPEGSTLDPTYWSTSTSGNGAVTQTNSLIQLKSGSANSFSASIWSNRRARHVTGATNQYRTHLRLGDVVTVGTRRRWGVVEAFGASVMPYFTDGAYFETSGSTFSVVTMKGGTETRVSSGSFNGQLGYFYTPTTNNTVWEIVPQNGSVTFHIGGVLLHKVSAATSPWANTMAFHAYADIACISSTASISSDIRTMNISRMGNLATQPQYARIATSTTSVCKYSAGNLQAIVLSVYGDSGAGLTAFDQAGGSPLNGPILARFSMNVGSQASNIGGTFDYKGIPFSEGLTILTSGGTPGDYTIIWD